METERKREREREMGVPALIVLSVKCYIMVKSVNYMALTPATPLSLPISSYAVALLS
jgi:hypothetical protein